jgi:hypothetical protein
MKTRMQGWLILGCLAGATALAADPARRLAHIDDMAQELPPIPGDLATLEDKLAAFERTSGIKILVEFHEHSPPAADDQVPGAYMRALSGRLGTLQRGVLVVYFAEESDWRVWIGDELTSRFVGKPGTVKQLTASGAIHDVKEALLTAAHEKAEAAFTALQKSMPGDAMPSQDLKLRLQTEALLDALMAKFSLK